MQEDRIRMNVTAFLYYGTIAFQEHGAALFNLHEQTAVAAAQKKKNLDSVVFLTCSCVTVITSHPFVFLP